jgi:hypothetical protein
MNNARLVNAEQAMAGLFSHLWLGSPASAGVFGLKVNVLNRRGHRGHREKLAGFLYVLCVLGGSDFFQEVA